MVGQGELKWRLLECQSRNRLNGRLAREADKAARKRHQDRQDDSGGGGGLSEDKA
jgi:hypothetical protein